MFVFAAKTRTFISLLVVILLAGCIFFVGCEKTNNPPQANNAHQGHSDHSAQAGVSMSDGLQKIVNNGKTWLSISQSWYGKKMPDFEFTDINGKSHSLSDYNGKKVMLVLWASWCVPCIQEIPHLVALRNIMSEEELAIIAIDADVQDSEESVRMTAAEKKINYTVAWHGSKMPAPLNSTGGRIPAAFFINPDSTVKLITVGSLHLGEMKSILLAE